MQSLQQTVFQNLSKKTQYYHSSKKISEKHDSFPKYREQEIANQFDLVDIHNQGRLSQKDIISYLSDKYQWLNTSVLKEVFRTMDWADDQTVTKDEFVKKYLAKERQLYNEIHGLKYYQNWVRTLQQIYTTELKTKKPRVYFYTQIRSIQLYQNSKQIEWMDLIVEYQNHETKTNYQIEQASHSASYPSFQIWLPANGEEFFIRFRFVDCGNRDNVYGQTYVNIPLEDKMSKMVSLDLEIMKSGQKVGHCAVYICAQPNMQKVKKQLIQIRQKQRTYQDLTQDKTKQYEYLQFLWGIRHKSPHKISPLDIKWMLAVRMILLVVIGVLGVVVHVLGRCQPLSIVIMFLMLRSWEFVLLRREKFMYTWLAVAGILVDVIWVALCSGSDSQINFIPLSGAVVVTYILLAAKAILLAYLLIAEQSLVSD